MKLKRILSWILLIVIMNNDVYLADSYKEVEVLSNINDEITSDSSINIGNGITNDIGDSVTSSAQAYIALSDTKDFYEYEMLDESTGEKYTVSINTQYSFYGDDNVGIVHTVSKASKCEINIPASIDVDGTTIKIVAVENGAFQQCNATKIILPSTMRIIGDRAFANCPNLKSVEINTVIGEGDYYNVNYNTNPDSKSYRVHPSSIGHYAFEGDTALESIYIKGMQTMGDYMFKDCTSLNNVVLDIEDMYTVSSSTGEVLDATKYPSSIRSYHLYMSAGRNMFDGCTGLTEVTIPSWFRSFGVNAFNGCSSLRTVNLGVDITGTLNADTFAGCTSLETINVEGSSTDPNGDNIGDDYIYIRNAAYRSIDGVLYRYTLEYKKDANGDNIRVYRDINLVMYPMSKKNENYTTAAGLVVIENKAMSNNPYIKHIIIDTDKEYVTGTNMISVGDSAFLNDTSLISLTFNNPVSLSSNVGIGCAALESLEFNGNVYIGSKAFMDCTELKNFKYSGYNGNLGSIGGYAFQNTGFVNLYLDGFRTISDMAFTECSKLETLEIDANVYVIGSNVFKNCTSLKTVDMTNVSRSGAFEGSIGTYNFKDCTALETVKWPVLSLGISTGTFSGCTALRTVSIEGESNMTSLCNLAFENCTSLESIPYSRFLAAIEANTFINCTSLKNIKISRSTINVKTNSFKDMASDFTIECVENSDIDLFAQDNKISVKYYEDDIDDEEFLVYEFISISKTEYDAMSKEEQDKYTYCEYNTAGAPVKWNRLEIKGYRGGFHNLIIDEPLTPYMSNNWIDKYTGLSMTSMKPYLNGIKLGGVYYIGNNAFTSTQGLETVIFDDNIKRIGDYAFQGCTKLNNSTYWNPVNPKRGWTGQLSGLSEEGVIDIGNTSERVIVGVSVFQNCSNMYHVDLPDSMWTTAVNQANGLAFPSVSNIISTNCFRNTGLIEVTTPGSNTFIDKNAFSDCKLLTEINFNPGDRTADKRDAISTAGGEAFANCTALTTVIFQHNQYLGADTFKGCTGINRIVMPQTTNVGLADPFPSTTECTAVCSKDANSYEYLVSKGFTIEEAQFLDGLYTVTLAFVTIPEGLSVTAVKASNPNEEVVLKNGDYMVDGDKYKVKATAVNDKNAVVKMNGNSINEDEWYEIPNGLTKIVFDLQYVDSLIAGDTDCDGVITGNDAALVLQYTLNSSSIPLSEAVLRAVDVDGDGVITGNDAACIMQKALNGSFKFPVEIA